MAWCDLKKSKNKTHQLTFLWLNSGTHLSNAQNPYDIPLHWLINRDPYNGLLSSLYNMGSIILFIQQMKRVLWVLLTAHLLFVTKNLHQIFHHFSPLLCDSALRRLHALKNTPRGREHIQMARPREKLGILFMDVNLMKPQNPHLFFWLGFFMLKKKNSEMVLYTLHVFFSLQKKSPFFWW